MQERSIENKLAHKWQSRSAQVKTTNMANYETTPSCDDQASKHVQPEFKDKMSRKIKNKLAQVNPEQYLYCTLAWVIQSRKIF